MRDNQELEVVKLSYLTRKWGSLDQLGRLITKTQTHFDL